MLVTHEHAEASPTAETVLASNRQLAVAQRKRCRVDRRVGGAFIPRVKLANPLTGLQRASPALVQEFFGLAFQLNEIRARRESSSRHMNSPFIMCPASASAGR